MIAPNRRGDHQTVERVAALQPRAIAGCHTPVVAGERVAQALDITRRTPGLTVPAQPDQAVLDEIQHTHGPCAGAE